MTRGWKAKLMNQWLSRAKDDRDLRSDDMETKPNIRKRNRLLKTSLSLEIEMRNGGWNPGLLQKPYVNCYKSKGITVYVFDKWSCFDLLQQKSHRTGILCKVSMWEGGRRFQKILEYLPTNHLSDVAARSDWLNSSRQVSAGLNHWCRRPFRQHWPHQAAGRLMNLSQWGPIRLMTARWTSPHPDVPGQRVN